jgi:hypothetical protein
MVTKEEYEANLDDNLADLVVRMKSQAYKPQPVRRVYIPKPGTDKKRPLGIPAYEDKLVQAALSEILNAIYEADFLDCSYGFRPGRGCHDALGALAGIIEREPVNYIVDADIKGFFDHVDHEWLMKFLEVRIADRNLLRIIARFLKAGMMEAGIRYDTPEGTPQGGSCSPILANIYLHYALDLWFHQVARKSCKGKAFMVRYADDCAPRRRRAVLRQPEPCLTEDEGGPLGAAVQAEASNHRKLLWAKAMVVSVTEKARLDLVRCVPMETNTSEPLIKCRKRRNAIKTGGKSLTRDKSGGYLLTAQVVAGMEAA